MDSIKKKYYSNSALITWVKTRKLSQNLECFVFLSLAKELMRVVKYFIFCRFRIPMQKSWCYQLGIPTFILKDFSQNLKDIVGGVIINVFSLIIGSNTQLKLTTHFPEKHRMIPTQYWNQTFSSSHKPDESHEPQSFCPLISIVPIIC